MKKIRHFCVLVMALLLLVQCSATNHSLNFLDETGANGLLTPRAIFARNIEALGGEEVIRSHSSTTSRGRFELPAMGIGGDMEILSAAPNKIRTSIELSGMGTIKSGFDGELGWNVDPFQGNSVLEGDALTDMTQLADYYAMLNYASIYEQQETLEIAQVNGNDAYKLRLTDSRGKETLMYFSVESSLLVRTDATASTPIGDVPTITIIEGYKDFGGYMLATKLSIEQAGQEITFELSTVTFDNVSDDSFAIPAEIQALLN